MTRSSGQVEFYSIMLVTPYMNTASYTATKSAKYTHNIFAWSHSQFNFVLGPYKLLWNADKKATKS